MSLNFEGLQLRDLEGRTVVLTGATGGLGQYLCRYLLACNAEIVMVNRNQEKAEALCKKLKREYKNAEISSLLCDLSDMEQVKQVSAQLQQRKVDVLMLNAGTYAIPRALSAAGFDTVFQVNFLSQYYLLKALLPQLKAGSGKVVVTGSIAHQFNRLNPADPDFSHRRGANNVYGNSKRFLMFAPMELLKNSGVSYAIGHPGISYTGITAAYPAEVLKIVKPGMELMFQHPELACRSVVRAVMEEIPYGHWVGPGYFDIWGRPVISPLHSCEREERKQILQLAEEMVRKL